MSQIESPAGSQIDTMQDAELQAGELQDRELACRDCGAAFVFSLAEQLQYRERGFEHEPSRCPECRGSRRNGRRGGREVAETICAGCGIRTEVPFRPTGDKPVFCRDCYAARQPA